MLYTLKPYKQKKNCFILFIPFQPPFLDTFTFIMSAPFHTIIKPPLVWIIPNNIDYYYYYCCRKFYGNVEKRKPLKTIKTYLRTNC